MIEISEPDKGLNFLFVHRNWPFCDAGDLDGIHLNPVVRDDHAKIFDAGFFELTLLVSEVQVVFVHAIQDDSSDPAMFFEAVCEDKNVVEVDGDDTLCDEVFEDFVHHCLEGRR